MSEKFIFKTKTQEGTIIKNLIELIQQCIKTACLEINERGIFLVTMDAHFKTLIDFKLERENFLYYHCERPITIGINVNHLHKMLKSVKKKESIILFISHSRPDDLAIKIEPKDTNSRSNVTYIKIQPTHTLEIDLPTGYGIPIVTPSNNYQKMCKDMANISKTMDVIFNNDGKLHFICDAGHIYSREVSFGGDDMDICGLDEQLYNDLKNGKLEENSKSFLHEYNTNTITKLVKMTGLSQTIQISIGEHLPLKFTLKVGTLGVISLYIKSNDQLLHENDYE